MKSRSVCQTFLVSLIVASAFADEHARRLRELEEHYRKTLVEVTYRQQVSRSTAEPPAEQELRTTGVVVSPEGLVMVSSIIYEPFNEVPHGVGIRFPASVSRAEAKVVEARARTMDGRELPLVLVGRDPEADVAFFRIDTEASADVGLAPLRFAPASVSVGDEVVVVSLVPEPVGPVVAVELSRVQAMTARPRGGFIVSTGAVDPVGGVVVTLDGTVAGYLDALTVSPPDTRSRNPLAFVSVIRKLSEGVGRAFARPSSDFVDVVVRAPENEPARRGWLGVEMQALTRELAEHMGLPVAGGILLGYVYRDSPAERAGFQVGDVLVSLDGEPIAVERDDDLGTFAEKLLRAGAGAALELGYLREGVKATTTATLAPAPRSAREARTVEVEELDLTVRELTYDYRATRFLEPGAAGVVVVEAPVGVASNPNRVAPGDLLVRVGDDPIVDLEAFEEVVAQVRERRPDEVVLFIERGKESFFFAVKPDWPQGR